jgi:hypothetical protein
MADSPEQAPDATPGEQPPRPDRRALIAGVAALVAGAMAKVTERSAEAADGGPLLLGQVNNATQPTRLFRVGPPLPTFEANAIGGGPALVGEGGPFAGSLLVTATAGLAAIGEPAILAGLGDDPLVLRDALAAAGDLHGALVGLNLDTGAGPTILGLRGPTADPLAVTLVASAVQGVAFDDQSIGGLFENVAGGLGLRVRGAAVMDHLQVGTLDVISGGPGDGGPAARGNGVIPAGQRRVTVQSAGVNPQSAVHVVLTEDPGLPVPPDIPSELVELSLQGIGNPATLGQISQAFQPFLGAPVSVGQLQGFVQNPGAFSIEVLRPFHQAAQSAGLIEPFGSVAVQSVRPMAGAFEIQLTRAPRDDVTFKFVAFDC